MTAPLSRNAWLAGHGAGLRGERPLPTILELMDALPQYQGPSWAAWRAFLAAVFVLPMSSTELEVYRTYTARANPPKRQPRKVAMVVGRRGGKGRTEALIATYLSAFRDYTPYLAPGQFATYPLVATAKIQAQELMGYLRGIFDRPPLSWLLLSEPTSTRIELATRVAIEVRAGSFRTIQAPTSVGAGLDEIAYWQDDSGGSRNPDSEVVKALEPCMATIPNALLTMLSSPYARRGVLWEMYDKHFGREDSDNVLVWQADTLTMHPGDPQLEEEVRRAYAEDPVDAAMRYGAQFRGDVASALPQIAVDKAIDAEISERLPEWQAYYGFVDPAGGGDDSMALAIAHHQDGQLVVDALREWRPPLDTNDAVKESAELLKSYRIDTVFGDHYAGVWPRDRFKEHGIVYVPSKEDKNDLYHAMVPAFLAGRVRLVNHDRLRGQLLNLDRKEGAAGKDRFDHPPGGHDDLANVVAGAIFHADLIGTRTTLGEQPLPPPKTIQEMKQQERLKAAEKREADYCKRLRGGGWTGAWGRVAMYRRAKR